MKERAQRFMTRLGTFTLSSVRYYGLMSNKGSFYKYDIHLPTASLLTQAQVAIQQNNVSDAASCLQYAEASRKTQRVLMVDALTKSLRRDKNLPEGITLQENISKEDLVRIERKAQNPDTKITAKYLRRTKFPGQVAQWLDKHF